ncbi:CAP domain-containing protein [Candidatus Peregrinibacteria bacterium]|nr:CAP domain-containing protein [Candidatus Peregrinibacteria bacterium]
MKKVVSIVLAVVLCVPTILLADGMDRIRRVNTPCRGVDSEDVKVSRSAITMCGNLAVLEATALYHPDLGTRFHAVKRLKDKNILEKVRALVEKIKPKTAFDKKMKPHLLKLLEQKIGKKKAVKKEAPISVADIRKMTDIGQLSKIFNGSQSFEVRLAAVKRVVDIFSFIDCVAPDKCDATEAEKSRENLEKIRAVVIKAIPLIEKLKAIEGKEELLAELRKMEVQLSPEPGEEAYIDRELLLEEVNKLRAENNLDPIEGYDERLDAAALGWAKMHFEKQLPALTHKRKGSTPKKRVLASGFQTDGAGENLARPIMSNARVVFTDWLSSESHRENMLDGDWTKMGVACVYAPYAKGGLTEYVCAQVFAMPETE